MAQTRRSTSSRRPAALPPVTTTAQLEAAWAPPEPPGNDWTPRPWVSIDERVASGKEARARVPRSSHATLDLAPGRDPLAIILQQEADRLPDLLPLRHQRMAASPFAFYRGAPAVMAFDLSTTPRSAITVQASGDAHISNFGLFASPERNLVFDTNDFDETIPGPWEWDVKRLAVSVVIASRANGFSGREVRTAVLGSVRAYRERMARYTTMPLMEIWYDQTTADDISRAIEKAARRDDNDFRPANVRKNVDAIFMKARAKDQMRAVDSLTEVVDGVWRIKEDPPVVTHVDIPGGEASLEATFQGYRATLAQNRRELIERYRFVDVALKVVGVGSVGTRCFVVLLEGRDRADPLILQAKEASASVLAPYLEASRFVNQGQRVVVGQRLMQATPDIFLGWTRGPGGRDYYFRQLWDQKGSVDPGTLRPAGMTFYGGLCAQSLARVHARTGDAIAIGSYLGSADTFDEAIADFSEAYADQNALDYAAFIAAIDAGAVISGSD